MRVAMSLVLLALVQGGCVMSPVETDGLPTGVTLLGSDEGECDGPLQIEGDPDRVIEESEDATFAVNGEDDLEWECVADSFVDEGELDCPDDTSYVRVLREEDDDEFAVECYG